MKKIVLIIVLIFLFNSLVLAHDSYTKGDVIKFKGVNWIVIKDSSEEDDYVIALKDKWLTNEELGEYAYLDTDTMVFGESSDYSISNVKKLLENSYLNTLGADNLKEVSGYKIRLLSHEEVLSAMNSYSNNGYLWMSSDAEEWLYKDLDGNIVVDYWCGRSNTSRYVLSIAYVKSNGLVVYGNDSYNLSIQVRPVINLLKSSILSEDSANGSTDEEQSGNQNHINENEVNITDNKSSEVVKVPNTLIKAPMIFIICGLSLVCLGTNIYIIFLDRKKK